VYQEIRVEDIREAGYQGIDYQKIRMSGKDKVNLIFW